MHQRPVRTSRYRPFFSVVMVLAAILSVTSNAPPTSASPASLDTLELTAALPPTLGLGHFEHHPEKSEDRCPVGSTCTMFTISNCPGVTEDRAGYLAVAPAVGPSRGMVVIFSAGGGTFYWSAGGPLPETQVKDLQNGGLTVVQVRWTRAWEAAAPGEDAGAAHVACRPATATKWIHQNLYVDAGNAGGECGFCVAGGSGGSAQAAYPLSHFGLDSILDAAVLIGGPTHSAITKGCLRNPEHEWYWYSGGATRQIDSPHGYIRVDGPCALNDPWMDGKDWVKRWDEEAVATGGSDYTHPSTRIHFVIGEKDRPMQAHGGDYLDRLVAGGSPRLKFEVVPDMNHGLSTEGFAIVTASLLQGSGSPPPPTTSTTTTAPTTTTTTVPSNTTTTTTPPGSVVVNGGFENGLSGWMVSGATSVSAPVRGGVGAARLGPASGLQQTVTVPANGQLELWVRVEGNQTTAGDSLFVQLGSGRSYQTLTAVGSNARHDEWLPLRVDLSNRAGESLTLRLLASSDDTAASPTTFFVDDVALRAGDGSSPSTTTTTTTTTVASTTTTTTVPTTTTTTVPPNTTTTTTPPGSVVVNGGFENGLDGWLVRGATSVSAPVHGGGGAARLGPATALQQTVTVPADGQLELWVRVEGNQTTAGDSLFVQLGAGRYYETVTAVGSEARHDEWLPLRVDLSNRAGESLTLRLLASSDDNAASPTTFFVDDVALRAGNGSSPSTTTTTTPVAPITTTTTTTPTATTTTTTPLGSVVVNGGFEDGFNGWTRRSADLVSTPTHAGQAAARLGGAVNSGHGLQQGIDVPAGATLELWVWVEGSETNGNDTLLIQMGLGRSYTTVAAVSSSSPHGRWQQVSVPLTDFGGSRTLQLLASNDGSVPTTFFVDDVAVR